MRQVASERLGVKSRRLKAKLLTSDRKDGLGISNVYQQQFRESSYSSIQLSSSGLDEILEKLDNPVITVKIILCEL